MKKTIDSVLEFCDRNSLLKESVSNNVPVTKTDITNAALRKIGYRKISFDPSDMSGSNSLRSFRCAEIFKETVNEIAKKLGFNAEVHYSFKFWSTDVKKANEAAKTYAKSEEALYLSDKEPEAKELYKSLKKKASELGTEIASSEEHKKAIEMLIDALAEKFRISVPR